MRRLSPLALVSLVAAGCGGDSAAESSPTTTAPVTTAPVVAPEPGQERATILVDQDPELVFALDTCEYDELTYHLGGRAPSGEAFEAVVVMEPTGYEGVSPAASLTMSDAEGTEMSAIGAEAWAQRGGTGTPPGEISVTRNLRAVVEITGAFALVDEDEQPTSDPDHRFMMHVYCNAKFN